MMYEFEKRISVIRFCRNCTIAALANWKGWPIRDRIPILPIVRDDDCPLCGCTEKVISTNIFWLNIHSEYSTGLPDYWVLKINRAEHFEKRFLSKWGLPYFEMLLCNKCGSDLLTSIFFPPVGWQLRKQCTRCDFTEVKEIK